MPLVSLLNNGNIPLRQSGVAIPRTAQLTAGETGLGTVLRGAGQALSDVAKQMREMELQAQRADDARQLVELEGMMNQAQIRQLEFQQQNQEQDEWLPQWEQESKALSDQLGKMKLSPEAQLTAKETVDKFSANGTLRVMGQSYAKAQDRGTDAILNRMATANEDEIPVIINMAKSSGLKTPEFWDAQGIVYAKRASSRQLQGLEQQKLEAIRVGDFVQVSNLNAQIHAMKGFRDDKEYQAEQKRAMEGQLERDILSMVDGSLLETEVVSTTGEQGQNLKRYAGIDFEGARKALESTDILPAQEKQRISAEIDRYQRRWSNTEIAKTLDDLAQGKIKSSADVDLKYSPPAVVAKVKQDIDEAIPPTNEETAAFYLNTRKLIESIDPEMMKEEDPATVSKWVASVAQINQAPTHIRDRLATVLRKQLSDGPDATANATYMRGARDALSDILELKKPEYFTPTSTGKMVLNPKRQAEWLREQSRFLQMENEVEKRLKAIPDPTDKQYLDILNAVMGADMTSARQSEYLEPRASGFEMTPLPGPARRVDGIDASLFPSSLYP